MVQSPGGKAQLDWPKQFWRGRAMVESDKSRYAAAIEVDEVKAK
jgi:hypothetical protein